MNSWFKLALYAFIGIVIGSLLLGIFAPGSNGGFNPNPMGGYENFYKHGTNNMR